MARNEKFLSLILRHQPELVGITLDEGGWVNAGDLVTALEKHGRPISTNELHDIVNNSDKRRFEWGQGGKLRACQGHSVEVDLGLKPLWPLKRLYHGTMQSNIPSILSNGLNKRQRQHVHLSEDIETATKVGARRGTPVVLTILAQDMHQTGCVFYKSTNGVWLTDHVPPQFIEIPLDNVRTNVILGSQD